MYPYFLLKLIDGIQKICGERDEWNEATTSQLRAVLPHQWAIVATSDLVEILKLQRNRLRVTQDREFLRCIEEDHKSLKRAISNETSLWELLEQHDSSTTFSKGWKSVNSWFPHLMAFSGGLSTVFPGTAVVESDFSVIKYEKNSFRSHLLDLTLEEIVHCKQYGRTF